MQVLGGEKAQRYADRGQPPPEEGRDKEVIRAQQPYLIRFDGIINLHIVMSQSENDINNTLLNNSKLEE